MTKETFGAYLRKLRLEKGFGLRKFAKLVDILPSNLCHIESGKHNPPQNQEALRKMAEILNLKEGGKEWNKLFDLAVKTGEIPLDVKGYMCERDIVEALPLLARAIKDRKLTKEEIKKLIDDLKKL